MSSESEPSEQSRQRPAGGGASGSARPAIAIIGAGLIGGSLGMALRSCVRAQVRIYDRRPESSARALERGAADLVAASIAEAVSGVQAAFIATPLRSVERCVREALDHAPADCVLSDVGSTKSALVEAIADERFVGGHPLAGAEGAGIDSAHAELFAGAIWYLTPRSDASGVLYERLHRLIAAIGAQPVALDARVHDRLMAFVSHLPHVLANVMIERADALRRSDSHLQAAFPGAARGPSFRDLTRVAGANAQIWSDIFAANHVELTACIDALLDALQRARGLIVKGDPQELRDWQQAVAKLRAELAPGALRAAPAQELRVHVPNRPGVVAQIALALGRAGVNITDLSLQPEADNSAGVISLWVGGAQEARRGRALIAELGFSVRS
jgi:prephenate dehydrogenase